MNQARNRAVKLMQHYFTLCAKQSGVNWDSDNLAEIESIVDDLIEAAVEQMRDERDAAPWRDPNKNPYLLSSDR
jgi:hypothetical protein